MEKLIKKFEELVITELPLANNKSRKYLKSQLSPEWCAEECKKVAIAFAVYCSDEDLHNVVLSNGKEVFMQIDTGTLTHEQVFDKFLEEKYGKE